MLSLKKMVCFLLGHDFKLISFNTNTSKLETRFCMRCMETRTIIPHGCCQNDDLSRSFVRHREAPDTEAPTKRAKRKPKRAA